MRSPQELRRILLKSCCMVRPCGTADRMKSGSSQRPHVRSHLSHMDARPHDSPTERYVRPAVFREIEQFLNLEESMNIMRRIDFRSSSRPLRRETRLRLRCLVLASLVILAGSLAPTIARAEPRTLKVPFSFAVNGKIWPAGQYSVERDQLTQSVTLRSLDATQHSSWGLGPGDPAPTDHRVVLRFDAIGDSYALRSLQFNSLITARLDKKLIRKEQLPAQFTVEE
jgi:hypothetical protein